MDDFVLKLRMARHLRTPEYNELFGGDPNVDHRVASAAWARTGGTLVTKNCYRVLNTLYNAAARARAEPDGAVERAAARDLQALLRQGLHATPTRIQYENDDVMRPRFGDDYAIACCVSAMRVGKEMQFFGARCQPAQSSCCWRSTAAATSRAATRSARKMPVIGRASTLDYDAGHRRALTATVSWLARPVRQRHERHPLHARQVRLRKDPDGPARHERAPLHGLWHGRALELHGGLPLGDPVRAR